MDPFSLVLLSAGALGMAMASSTERQDRLEAGEEALWDIFGIVPWHFAASWDWEPFAVTVVTGPSSKEAEAAFEAEVTDWGDYYDVESYKHRVYAIVRGGQRLAPDVPPPTQPLPAGATLNIIWQAERSIDGIQLELDHAMSIDEALRLAWKQVPEDSDVKLYAYESGFEDDEPIGPDLVVLGGDIVHVARL